MQVLIRRPEAKYTPQGLPAPQQSILPVRAVKYTAFSPGCVEERERIDRPDVGLMWKQGRWVGRVVSSRY